MTWRLPHVITLGDGRRVLGELGRYPVPVRHADPHGASFELAYVRLPASTPRPGPPIVLLAGGPGDSGTEIPTWDDPGQAEWIEALRGIGDVIGLDQRGTGLSVPVPESVTRWGLPLDEPIDRDASIAVASERLAELRAWWSDLGLDVDAYTTEESADDVAELARVLGVDRVRLIGASYGSHLGLSVIRRHGSLVDRAVLALVEGPDHTHKLPSIIEANLARIAERAGLAPELEGGMPDLLGLIEDLLARLRAAPAPHLAQDRRVVVGPFDLQRAISACMGSQSAIAKLPGRLRALADGDLGWLGRSTLERRTEDVGNLMYWQMDAASGASAERRARIRDEAPVTLLGDAINHPFPEVEVALGSPDLGDAFRAPVQSEVPVQFLSGGLDGRTPISNVGEVSGGFPTSGHLIVDGVAHDTGIASPEVRSALVAFLDGGDPVTRRVSLPFAFVPLGQPAR